MKNLYNKLIFISLTCILIFSLIYTHLSIESPTKGKPAPKIRSSFSPKAEPYSAEKRDDYFFQVLRNPVTNSIPENIRSKENRLFQTLKSLNLKSTLADNYTWSEVGPYDVGGRTRALAIDIRNPDVIMAGGVSGGIWKSTDKGQSWILKTTQTESFAVNSICQDPRSGHQNTWYYVGGEYSGNSAKAPSAFYHGYGLHRSTDNGETWQLIIDDSKPYAWSSLLDYASKIKVDASTGIVYIACNGYGIVQVVENAGQFSLVKTIGNDNDHNYADFDIDYAGNMLVTLSQSGYNEIKENNPGIYFRPTGSTIFTKIEMETSDPDGFPTTFSRSLIHFAPSDNTRAYVYTVDGSTPYFHVININQVTPSSSSLVNRTANLPTYGKLGDQGSYNMTLAVKPDDKNFVIIGSTSLLRSNDGFATTPAIDYGWIGGYGPDGSDHFFYPNHHPDCHITLFDPSNSKAIWSGHDGGLSYLADVTSSLTLPELLPWQDMNNGYNVTQFYTLASPTMANEDRYLGGTQDNGSPYFKSNITIGSQDISSGDGAYCHFAKNYTYISTQNGKVMRTGYNKNTGEPLNPYSSVGPYDWSRVHPNDATGQLFINPFCIDTNGDTTMYYAGGEQLWINLNVEKIPNYEIETMAGWYAPSALDVPGELITCLASSKVPEHILYYATQTSGKPKLYRVDQSTANELDISRTEIIITGATDQSYPYYIAINPYDANEIILVFANYGVPSLFHSTDGGDTFTIIDGNLTATAEIPGPSIRSAAILNWNGEKSYYISTSIGVYQTNTLSGASTQWVNIDNNNLGNVVCNRVKASEYDGKVVIATHGRGIFKGESSNGLFINEKIPNKIRLTTSASEILDISNVFSHKLGSDISINLSGNSSPEVASAMLNGTNLTLDYANNTTGQTIISLEATAGAETAQTAFSITVNQDLTTSVEEIPNDLSDNKYQIYPNPTNGLFNINIPDINQPCKVEIFNMAGHTILTQSFRNRLEAINYSFDISKNTSGTYIVVLTIDDTQKRWKINKN